MYERPIVAKMTMMKKFSTPNMDLEENKEFERQLTMQLYFWKPKATFYNALDPREGKWVLHFDGGPTGFETYYVDVLLEADKEAEAFEWFGICAGTFNRWPKCEVRRSEVMAFLFDHLEEITNKPNFPVD